MASITVFAPDDAFAEFSFASDSLKLDYVLIDEAQNQSLAKMIALKKWRSEEILHDRQSDHTRNFEIYRGFIL